MSTELELEEASRNYAIDPSNRAHRERLAALNEQVAVVDKEYAGLPCAPALLVHGKPRQEQGTLTLATPAGLPKLELQWRSVDFSPEDEQLGFSFFDPFGAPGFSDVLYRHDQDASSKSAKDVCGYALVRFTLDGEPMTMKDERYSISPFWDDGSERWDTNFGFPGPRLSCNGTWLVLTAMCNLLPAWGEELRLSSLGYCATWASGRSEGEYALTIVVEYYERSSGMPRIEHQEYYFDFNDRSYTYKHIYMPTEKRED